ncbi:MAG: hypothetical protein ACE5HU_10245 [Acidobacteriota bacterium]
MTRLGGITRETGATRLSMRALIRIYLCFAAGLYFAWVQFSYFFLLEAFLSASHVSYFVALFFWLGGFLVGLNASRKLSASWLLAIGVGAYYATWALVGKYPFRDALYPVMALGISTSAILPGFFFPLATRLFPRVKSMLIHENNGFIVGIASSLVAMTWAGRLFLDFAPLLGCILLMPALRRAVAPIEPEMAPGEKAPGNAPAALAAVGRAPDRPAGRAEAGI